MDYQKNEFEVVVRKEGDGRYQGLANFLSPATIFALEQTEEKFKKLEGKTMEDVLTSESEEWAKLTPQQRVQQRFLADNVADEERALAAYKYATLTNQDVADVGVEMNDLPDDMFADVTFDSIDEDAYYSYEQPADDKQDLTVADIENKELLEKQFEADQERARKEVIAEEIRVSRTHESGTLEERVRDIRHRVGLDTEQGGITYKEASRLITEAREDSERFLNQLAIKEKLLYASEEEIAKHEREQAELEKQYAEYAQVLFNAANGIETQIRIDMDKFINGKKAEGIEIDRAYLRDQIRKYKLRPSTANHITERVTGSGEIDAAFQKREAVAYARIKDANDGLTEAERLVRDKDLYKGGQVVRDVPQTTKSNTSQTSNDIPWTETTTTTRQDPAPRSYRTEAPLAETLTDSISRSVELQKERAEAKMRHNTASAAIDEEHTEEAPRQQAAPRQAQREHHYEEPKPRGIRGFFSFFSRKKSEPRGINDVYEESSRASVFGEEKPENYFEFRATAKGLAERGMYLGGATDAPLLPPKEEQMREVNRVRGFRRKVRAYVQTRRFRVSVKVAAYCAFTIGLSMMGGESSIENREQYIMAFVSMFGGLLLMNSIREDGIDLPAMPFGPPRKNDGTNGGTARGNGGNSRF